jgi:hypothetical protein
MFHAEYSSGSPLRMLVDLRNVVDAALSRTSKKAEKVSKAAPEPPVLQAKAAAAGAQSSTSSFAGFATSDSDGAEFEVTAAPDWDQDPSATDQAPGDDDKV